MQLTTDDSKKELKEHGTYMFPLLISYEKITAYESGSFIWHWHPEIELTLITNGEMIYQINNQKYHVKKGNVIFCNINALHTGSMYHDHDCTYTSITFDPRLIYGIEGSSIHNKYVKPLVNNFSLSSFCFDCSEDWHISIRDSILRISKLYEVKAETYEIDILIEMFMIVKKIHLNMSNNSKFSYYDKLNYDRIRTIMLFIENNYNSELTLNDIANQVHLCKNECCRIFKHYMFQSLFDFILDIRIEKSINFLMESSYSISEIASMVGFNDSNYFSRIFKKKKGLSPTQYRKKLKYTIIP